ncbi:MAG: DJ-1/PfpI family protein [Deltaproteobacteria bacterium]|nr:DJ-1/PfpI family protein [Deltaproteobacteria bacterium]
MTEVEILLFDGLDELDALGPFEVLRQAERTGAPLSCRLATLAGAREVEGANGLTFRAGGPLGRPGWIVVPGGGWGERAERGAWGEARRGGYPRALAEAHARGTRIASVCTGAMLVAEAGLLRGRPAVTHRTAMGALAAAGAEPVDARVVDDGDLMTAGGISSGLDLGLWLVSRLAGPAVAAAVAEEMELTQGKVHLGPRAAPVP